MTQQIINVGQQANSGGGDPLRDCMIKINENFTELYDAVGLGDGLVNLGSLEFNGSTITTTDSSRIEIAQEVRITSDLTMRGSIVPNIDNHFDLGSLNNQWRSLYVSGSTIYIGGNSLSVDSGGELILNNNRLVQDNGNYISLNSNVNDVQISDLQPGDTLQWAGGFWVNSRTNSVTGDITGSVFADDSTILVDGVSGKLRANVETITDWSVTVDDKVWTFDGFGGLTFPGNNSISTSSGFKISPASGGVLTLGTLYEWQFDDSNGKLFLPIKDSADTGDLELRGGGIYQIVDEDLIIGARDADDDGFSVYLQVDDGTGSVFSETRLRRDRFTVNIDKGGANHNWSFDDTGWFELAGDIRAAYGVNTSIYLPGSSDSNTLTLKTVDNTDTVRSYVEVKNTQVKIASGGNSWTFGDDGRFTAPGEVYGRFFSLRGGNLSGTIGTVGYGGDRVEISGLQGVGIVGGLDELSPIWDFGTDGNLTTPGDITVAGDITGTSGANTLVLKAQPNSGTAIQLNDTVDSIINTVANLEIRTDVSDTAKTWTFESDGTLTVPGTITSSDGFLYLGYDFSSTPDVYIGAAGGGKVIRLESDRLQVFANPPTTSKGISGDNAGMLAFDNNYVYYCTAAHTDGLADIWKRVAWSGDVW